MEGDVTNNQHKNIYMRRQVNFTKFTLESAILDEDEDGDNWQLLLTEIGTIMADGKGW